LEGLYQGGTRIEDKEKYDGDKALTNQGGAGVVGNAILHDVHREMAV
jgi:hypothetical protein